MMWWRWVGKSRSLGGVVNVKKEGGLKPTERNG